MESRSRVLPLNLPAGSRPSRNPEPELTASPSRTARASGAEKWLLRKLLEMMGEPPIRFVFWDGQEIAAGAAAPAASMRLGDRPTLLRLLLQPGLHFGDAYSEGRLQVEGDLVKLMEILFATTPDPSRAGVWGRLLSSMRARRPRINTLGGSRDNIHHHYDLGNDFYRLWLDDEMLYTCAYYASPSMTLEEAQIAKMDHVCRKLELRPGDTVIEAGCGWGSLALHMAQHYGATVRAFNISPEQIAYARERAARAGVGDRVEYLEDDYRNISGKCDVFASVGMLEHVGKDNYATLGEVIHRCLRNDGRALIHTIGRNRPQPLNAWIEKRIFPGAYPPTLREMMDIFEPWGFSVLDVENLRLHYARTLTHWLERYEEKIDRVRAMFDERFARAWRFYLSGSAAAFTASKLQLFQVVLAHGTSNRVPRTRGHLYSRD